MIRYSKEEDLPQIEEIMNVCFGVRNDSEWKTQLEGRYLVYELNGKLVAMTGLRWSKEYRAYEVDWTGTLPNCRHKGFMQELFKRMLYYVDYDVYCSCWRLSEGGKINLHTLMSMFGFEEVLKPRVSWDVRYNCSRRIDTCVYCVGDKCHCWEDLYLRRGKIKVSNE